MDCLSPCLTTLQFCGIWPSSFHSGWKKIFYGVYTSVTAATILSFLLSGVIQLCLVTRSVDDFIRNSYMLLTTFTVSVKVVMIILKHDQIIATLNILHSNLCKAQNQEEKQIQCKSDSQLSYLVRVYGVLFGAAVGTETIASILSNVPSKTLPFSGWFPYDHTDSFGYWFAFIHQSLAHGWGASIAAAVDLLICGTMTLVCTQLKLLKCRLHKMPEAVHHQLREVESKIVHETKREKDLLARCIQHHLKISRFAEFGNQAFLVIIFIQFLISGIVVCMSVLMLSKTEPSSSGFSFVVVYSMSMVTQIFFFCWYGNEVILESSDIYMKIYEMDWAGLSLRSQKSLLIIMKRSMFPIEFTGSRLVILSIDSFNSLMKLSYSIYNLLS